MKSFVLSLVLLMVTTSNAFADGPGGGGTVGSDSIADKCIAKTYAELKNEFSNTQPYTDKFGFGWSYKPYNELNRASDKKAKRDVIEFLYTYELTFGPSPTDEVMPCAGYKVVYADTCELVMESGHYRIGLDPILDLQD